MTPNPIDLPDVYLRRRLTPIENHQVSPRNQVLLTLFPPITRQGGVTDKKSSILSKKGLDPPPFDQKITETFEVASPEILPHRSVMTGTCQSPDRLAGSGCDHATGIGSLLRQRSSIGHDAPRPIHLSARAPRLMDGTKPAPFRLDGNELGGRKTSRIPIQNTDQ
jgi:hypothetical protein